MNFEIWKTLDICAVLVVTSLFSYTRQLNYFSSQYCVTYNKCRPIERVNNIKNNTKVKLFLFHSLIQKGETSLKNNKKYMYILEFRRRLLSALLIVVIIYKTEIINERNISFEKLDNISKYEHFKILYSTRYCIKPNMKNRVNFPSPDKLRLLSLSMFKFLFAVLSLQRLAPKLWETSRVFHSPLIDMADSFEYLFCVDVSKMPLVMCY